jgi:uncharacterized membrane protein YhaH (DUF805 family)
MRRLINLDFKKDRFIYFSLILFIVYIVIAFIPEYTVGRRLKAILIYGTLFLSIIISFIGILNMIYNRRINYLKLLLLCFPFIYILILVISNI